MLVHKCNFNAPAPPPLNIIKKTSTNLCRCQLFIKVSFSSALTCEQPYRSVFFFVNDICLLLQNITLSKKTRKLSRKAIHVVENRRKKHSTGKWSAGIGRLKENSCNAIKIDVPLSDIIISITYRRSSSTLNNRDIKSRRPKCYYSALGPSP